MDAVVPKSRFTLMMPLPNLHPVLRMMMGGGSLGRGRNLVWPGVGRPAWAVALAMQLVLAAATGAEPAASTTAFSPRLIGGTRPLDAAELAGTGLERGTSAALFVGVNEFGGDSGLPHLEFAVDDAVALAHVFVAELQIVPPGQTTLALGGEPRSPPARELLAALRKLQVKVTSAERQKLRTEIRDLSNRATDPRGLIVLSFSTHGFEKDGNVYVMPQDGLRESFWEDGIALSGVKETLRQAKANKRLLIYDACRREATRGGGMSDAYRSALAAAEGFGVLASCGAAEVSWEDPVLGHGVFTHFLIEGLRGAAPAEKTDGFLRLDSVARYAGSNTTAWVRAKKGSVQEPWKELSAQAHNIPLAVNTGVLNSLRAASEAEAERQRLAEAARQALQKRRDDAQDLLTKAQRANASTFPLGTKQEVETAIDKFSGTNLTTLLEQVELMTNARKATVDAFLAWWRIEGSRPAVQPASPAPLVSRSEVEPPNSSPPATGTDQARVKIEVVPSTPQKLFLEYVRSKDKALFPFDRPRYTNSLGMVLTSVPGVSVKFCIWETRVRDYEQYARSNPSADGSWKTAVYAYNIPVGREPDHPVVNVSWEDANAFCLWLTEKERRAGRIPTNACYRLPSDEEWSAAAGLAKEPGDTPAERGGILTGAYSWGTQWPPPALVENLMDETTALKVYGRRRDGLYVRGYDDGFVGTAPVGSFKPNACGLFDLGGNVSEWCLDPLEPGGTNRVTRGATYETWQSMDELRKIFDLGRRIGWEPRRRYRCYGFRVVLAQSCDSP